MKSGVMTGGQGNERKRLEEMTGDLEMIVEMDMATATVTVIENMLIQTDRAQHQAIATAAETEGHAVAVAVRPEKTIHVTTDLAIVRKGATTGDEEPTEHIQWCHARFRKDEDDFGQGVKRLIHSRSCQH